MRRTFLFIAVAGVSSQLQACGFVVIQAAKKAYRELTKDESDIDHALNEYRTLVMQGDIEKISNMFEPNAELSQEGRTPIVGRDAIRSFFTAFKNYKILEYQLESSRTSAAGSSGTQKGTYAQKLVSPDGKIAEVSGVFAADWSRQQSGVWLIRKLHTEATAR